MCCPSPPAAHASPSKHWGIDGGAETDPDPARIAVPVATLASQTPAGRYLFVVQDASDSSVLALPLTVVPKPEAQSVSGRVVAPTDANPAGAPPRDAVIWALKDAQTPVASANIRSDGSYTLPLPPGTYVLYAEWFGSLRSERKLCPIAAGVPLQNVNFSLLKAQEVNGRVMSSGNPAADAVVQATSADGKSFSARTLTDGSYTLVLPAGQYRVTAPGGTETVTVADQPIDDVDFSSASDSPSPAKGTIITVAGNGLQGLGGDGRRATSARVPNANAIALDRQDNLYIVDGRLHRVRAVRGGIITTVAGSSHPDIIRGLSADPRFSGGFSGDGGPAPAAQLNNPQGVTVDSAGDLFIADRGNHRIRKVDPNGIITTVAGSGPAGVGSVGSFAGDGGPATEARLNLAINVAIDSVGNLYIADISNRRIRKVIGVAAPGLVGGQ